MNGIPRKGEPNSIQQDWTWKDVKEQTRHKLFYLAAKGTVATKEPENNRPLFHSKPEPIEYN